jgi:hypothetical protein
MFPFPRTTKKVPPTARGNIERGRPVQAWRDQVGKFLRAQEPPRDEAITTVAGRMMGRQRTVRKSTARAKGRPPGAVHRELFLAPDTGGQRYSPIRWQPLRISARVTTRRTTSFGSGQNLRQGLDGRATRICPDPMKPPAGRKNLIPVSVRLIPLPRLRSCQNSSSASETVRLQPSEWWTATTVLLRRARRRAARRGRQRVPTAAFRASRPPTRLGQVIFGKNSEQRRRARRNSGTWFAIFGTRFG